MAVVLDLEVITVAKGFFIPLRGLFGLLILSLAQGVADFAAGAAAEADQAFVVLGQQ